MNGTKTFRHAAKVFEVLVHQAADAEGFESPLLSRPPRRIEQGDWDMGIVWHYDVGGTTMGRMDLIS
jgi:hypothetical protein